MALGQSLKYNYSFTAFACLTVHFMVNSHCEVMELMLDPLLLFERVILFSVDDDDSPLCITCGGIELTESKNFLQKFCSCSPASFCSDFNCSFSD